MLTLIFFVTVMAVNGQSVEQLIAQGDTHAQKEFNNEAALDKFLKAEKLSPNNWEVLWRVSRTYVDIGEHMPSGTDAQKQAQLAKYQESFNYANRAVKAGSDKSVTYLRRAIANGRIALFRGVFTAIGLVNDVKTDVEKAIQLGNGGAEIQAACHYILGRTHAKICEKPYLVRLPLGIGWGDMEVALKSFQKAIELRPQFRMYRLDYAKALIDEDDFGRAREQLNKIPAIPVSDEDDQNFAREAKALLEKIKNK